jgi:hypothetical protein
MGHAIASYPGVYLLARFERTVPSGPADYFDAAIVYVGEARNMSETTNSSFDRAKEAIRCPVRRPR